MTQKCLFYDNYKLKYRIYATITQKLGCNISLKFNIDHLDHLWKDKDSFGG